MQRLALVALVLAFGILAQQVFSRRRKTVLPAEADALRARLAMTTLRADEAERDLRGLSRMLDAIPGPVWRLDPSGNLVWANRFYHALGNDDLAVLDAAPRDTIVTLPGTPARALELGTAEVPRPSGAEDTTAAQAMMDSGPPAVIHYGLPADRLVETQASLRRFVETLTQTFAHLPIGLAIFDRDRRLGLFNPALADLLALDPSWLAAQPMFRAVMERLRDTGRMPDRADFQHWLQHLQSMESSAASGGYQESWVLPGGQNLRVTGRPHPDGALAFIFEDMTQLSHVENRHRVDIALNQAILDQMTEAVAVFDTTGALVFANQTFDALWQVDSTGTLLAPDIDALVAQWSRLGGAPQDWQALRAHVSGNVSGNGTRKSGQTMLELPDQGPMLCIWKTLPDGSALVYFKQPPLPARWSTLIAPLARALGPGHVLNSAAPADLDEAGLVDERDALRDAVEQLINQAATNPDPPKTTVFSE